MVPDVAVDRSAVNVMPPDPTFRVANWREYEAGLRRRGSLTLWVTPEALSAWQAPRRKTRGGQHRYSDPAIETALTLGPVFGLRLRQAEGLLESVLQLIGLALAVPDHTTLSHRARTRQSPRKRPDRELPTNGPLHVLERFMSFWNLSGIPKSADL